MRKPLLRKEETVEYRTTNTEHEMTKYGTFEFVFHFIIPCSVFLVRYPMGRQTLKKSERYMPENLSTFCEEVLLAICAIYNYIRRQFL